MYSSGYIFECLIHAQSEVVAEFYIVFPISFHMLIPSLRCYSQMASLAHQFGLCLLCLQWIRTYFLGYFSRCSEGVCFCFVVSFAGLFLLFEVLSGHILVCALVFYAVLLSDCMFRMRDCLEVANSCLAHVLCSLAFTKCYSVIFLQNVAYVQMFVVFRIGRW